MRGASWSVGVVVALVFLGHASLRAEEQAARLEVVSEPTGAQVFLDGSEMGLTPIELSDLEPGDHLLRLRLDGYLENSRSVLVVPDKATRMRVSLTPLSSNLPGAAAPPKKRGGKKKWLIAGAAVAAGSTGAYLAFRDTNKPPTLGAVSVSPSDVGVPTLTSFDIVATGFTDPDGDDLQYSWEFGDGLTGSGARTTHTFAAEGTFTPRVKVSDGKKSVSATGPAVSVRSLSGTWDGTFYGSNRSTLRLTQNGSRLSGGITHVWANSSCSTQGETIQSGRIESPRHVVITASVPTSCYGSFWGVFTLTYTCDMDGTLLSCGGQVQYPGRKFPITLTRR
jgi:hypothetical protein